MTHPRKVSPPRGRRAATTHKDLLALFPDLVQLAEAVDVPYFTVSSWKRRDNIPPEYWADIAKAARSMDVRGVCLASLRRIAALAKEERRKLRRSARFPRMVRDRIALT